MTADWPDSPTTTLGQILLTENVLSPTKTDDTMANLTVSPMANLTVSPMATLSVSLSVSSVSTLTLVVAVVLVLALGCLRMSSVSDLTAKMDLGALKTNGEASYDDCAMAQAWELCQSGLTA